MLSFIVAILLEESRVDVLGHNFMSDYLHCNELKKADLEIEIARIMDKI